MIRRLSVVLIICGLFGSVLLARSAVVTLTDGQRIEGDIVREDASSITVSIRGIETSIPRDRIEGISYFDSLSAQFEERRKALEPKDAPGHIALARWGFDNRLYVEAERLLQHVLAEVDPNSREAADLLNLVRRQIALERRGPVQPQPGGDQPAGGGDRAAAPDPSQYLTDEQIQIIKMMEVVENDPGIRLRMGAQTRRDLAEAARINTRQFANLSASRQLRLLREYGTDEMRADVEIQGDPVAIQVFRQRVQPIILSGCATAGCHGTAGAGDLLLFPRAEVSDAATYTNFLILQRYTQAVESDAAAGGPFGGGPGQRRMIDRTRPQESLLVQYMLPRNVAQYPHPQVPGYSGLVRNTSDQRITTILGWIRGLAPFEPNYPFDYTPPGQASTQPAQ